MWQLVRSVRRCAVAFGIDSRRMIRSAKSVPRFLRSAILYSRLHEDRDGFAISLAKAYPCLADWCGPAGKARGGYFHQDLWAARKIYRTRPEFHLDVGSRIDGFVAHLLCFMPVTIVDVRPLDAKVEGMRFVQADATTLEGFEDGSVESLSSLHAVEHFGLGRYGDAVDPRATFLAMQSLQRVLRPGGRLYFSVPIGRQRLEFNAHRIFAPATVITAFRGLRLVSFAAVDDAGEFREDLAPESFESADYACGMFEFVK